MERSRYGWALRAGARPGKVLRWAIAHVRKAFQKLKHRYGPRYTSALLLAVIVAFFVPVPGATLMFVALVVVVAESHRAISKRTGCNKAIGISKGDLGMSIQCDLIVRWDATPKELTALGAALWRWCNHASGKSGIYQHLDDQASADLIAGEFPQSSQRPGRTDPRGAHFRFRDEISYDRLATIESLRREIPGAVIADIVVDGISSWREHAKGVQTTTSTGGS